MWLQLFLACAEETPITGEKELGSDVELPPSGDWTPPADTPEIDEPRVDQVLYGPETLDFALELDAEALAGLATEPGADVPDVEGTFRWADQTWQVGVRLRGGAGSFQTMDGKPGFRLDFTAYGDDFLGQPDLTLKNMVQDEAMLREHATLSLTRHLGHPAPRNGYARLSVNGEPFGLYGVVEDPETEAFVERVVGEPAPLWEGQMDDFTSDLVGTFEPILGDGTGVLEGVVAELDGGGDLLEVLEARFDVDVLLDLMAVEIVSGNPDGYVTWTNNFYVIQRPEDGRLVVMPWSPDQAFDDPLSVTASWVGRLWSDCRAHAACSARLDERIAVVAGVLADEGWRAALQATRLRTEDDCLNDPRSPGGAAECADERADLFLFVETRPAQVAAELGG